MRPENRPRLIDDPPAYVECVRTNATTGTAGSFYKPSHAFKAVVSMRALLFISPTTTPALYTAALLVATVQVPTS